MTIDITLSQADWLKYQTYIQRKLFKDNAKKKSWWVNLLIWLFMGMIFMIFYRKFDSFHYPSAALVTIGFILISANYFYDMIKLKKAFMPSNEGTFLGKHSFIFDETGIHSEGKGYHSFHSWSVVKSIRHDAEMVMIFIDTAHALLFPDSQLADVTAFVNKINELQKGRTKTST